MNSDDWTFNPGLLLLSAGSAFGKQDVDHVAAPVESRSF